MYNLSIAVLRYCCYERISAWRLHEVQFDPREDIEFLFSESLPYHPNAVTFLADCKNGEAISETYYSVGGGLL
jgi:Serine dehydratase beta chain.